MSPDDNHNGEPSEAQEEAASELRGGGPGAVIYGDRDQDEADEIGKEMLQSPHESS